MNNKMMNCPDCGQEISKSAVSCPKCGHVLKKKGSAGCGCLITILTFIAITIGSVAMSTTTDNYIQSNISGVSDESEYITLAEYNQIQTGMTYDQVCKIIGSSGSESATSGSGEFTISMYSWYGNGMAGSSANVTFQNGKVSGKAQFGLK